MPEGWRTHSQPHPSQVGPNSRRRLSFEGHQLTRRFGQGAAAVDALRGVDVSFEQGSFTAIMGPSGSGKSTLMHILAGLDEPTSGGVELDGTRLGQLSDREAARRSSSWLVTGALSDLGLSFGIPSASSQPSWP